MRQEAKAAKIHLLPSLFFFSLLHKHIHSDQKKKKPVPRCKAEVCACVSWSINEQKYQQGWKVGAREGLQRSGTAMFEGGSCGCSTLSPALMGGEICHRGVRVETSGRSALEQSGQ